MTICVLSHKDGYSLRKGSFQEGWSGRLREIRESTRTRRTICMDCHIQTLCSMCSANGELENGDAEAPVDFLCQVAHLRAFSLGLNVPKHGECQCCSGGVHHRHLMESAGRLRQSSADSEKILPMLQAQSLFPILQSRGGCSAGGCSSCGTHAR